MFGPAWKTSVSILNIVIVLGFGAVSFYRDCSYIFTLFIVYFTIE